MATSAKLSQSGGLDEQASERRQLTIGVRVREQDGIDLA